MNIPFLDNKVFIYLKLLFPNNQCQVFNCIPDAIPYQKAMNAEPRQWTCTCTDTCT